MTHTLSLMWVPESLKLSLYCYLYAEVNGGVGDLHIIVAVAAVVHLASLIARNITVLVSSTGLRSLAGLTCTIT